MNFKFADETHATMRTISERQDVWKKMKKNARTRFQFHVYNDYHIWFSSAGIDTWPRDAVSAEMREMKIVSSIPIWS